MWIIKDLFMLLFVFYVRIESKMQDYTLDVNDILDDNLMPLSLMLIEERDNNEWKNLTSKKLDDEFQCITRGKLKENVTSIHAALTSMSYHRKMINEFLCSKFVAEKILEDIQPKEIVNRRLGMAQASPEIEFERNNSLSFDDGSSSRQRMLFDEGSYQYKNWLAKTTTLNDIYRTMGVSRNFNAPPQDKVLNNRNDQQYIDDASDDEYEEGEVNGFMVQRPLNTNNGGNSFNPNIAQTVPHSLNPMEKTGYQYGPTAPQQDYSYHSAPVSYHSGGGSEMKSVNLKDLFEIALTTLAFLSFGMFIVQVIMCITMAKSGDQSVMLPMEMTGDGAEAEAAELEVRVRRSIDKFERKKNQNINQVNEISKRALQSFEAFVIAKNDRGQCLKKFICENNKFSRRTIDLQKYLIPIFGLGLSWISNKINDMPIMSNLDNLQASLIGLGNGSCKKYKCDINILNHMRR